MYYRLILCYIFSYRDDWLKITNKQHIFFLPDHERDNMKHLKLFTGKGPFYVEAGVLKKIHILLNLANDTTDDNLVSAVVKTTDELFEFDVYIVNWAYNNLDYIISTLLKNKIKTTDVTFIELIEYPQKKGIGK